MLHLIFRDGKGAGIAPWFKGIVLTTKLGLQTENVKFFGFKSQISYNSKSIPLWTATAAIGKGTLAG
jgi:hypothetical protein